MNNYIIESITKLDGQLIVDGPAKSNAKKHLTKWIAENLKKSKYVFEITVDKNEVVLLDLYIDADEELFTNNFQERLDRLKKLNVNPIKGVKIVDNLTNSENFGKAGYKQFLKVYQLQAIYRCDYYIKDTIMHYLLVGSAQAPNSDQVKYYFAAKTSTVSAELAIFGVTQLTKKLQSELEMFDRKNEDLKNPIDNTQFRWLFSKPIGFTFFKEPAIVTHKKLSITPDIVAEPYKLVVASIEKFEIKDAKFAVIEMKNKLSGKSSPPDIKYLSELFKDIPIEHIKQYLRANRKPNKEKNESTIVGSSSSAAANVATGNASANSISSSSSSSLSSSSSSATTTTTTASTTTTNMNGKRKAIANIMDKSNIKKNESKIKKFKSNEFIDDEIVYNEKNFTDDDININD